MHTFEGKTVKIHYNSDLSGECIIVSKDSYERVNVASVDLINFIANHVRNQKISDLENMSSKEILGLK